MENNIEKIPKVIHYCWFGKKEKPKIVKKCIQSWKKTLPQYKIIEWNEDNFDIDTNNFVRQAYQSGKFAFVSDYVRVHVLYNYGGIYLDTDVQVVKSLDPFLKHESFWGFEEKNYIATSTIGVSKGNKLIKEFFDYYSKKDFIKDDGNIDTTTNVSIVTDIFKKLNVELDGKMKYIEGLATIYPQEYFSPFDYLNCIYKLTENSYTVHHFYKSWLPLKTRIKSKVKFVIAKFFGGNFIKFLRRIDQKL